MFRILKSWGLSKDIIRDAVSLSEVRVRRWQNGDLLGSQKANNKYGTQYVIHRADIHRLIFERAKSLPNVQVMTNTRVVDVDFDAPYVRLGDGRLISGDIVLGADGLKSTVRSIMTGEEVSPKPTGDCAYRLILPRDAMESDPDLKELVDSPIGTRWIGPNRHIMA